jgi:hypothetical protein
MSPTLPKRAVFGISQCAGITRLEQPRVSPGHPTRRRTRRKVEPSTLRISTSPYAGLDIARTKSAVSRSLFPEFFIAENLGAGSDFLGPGAVQVACIQLS